MGSKRVRSKSGTGEKHSNSEPSVHPGSSWNSTPRCLDWAVLDRPELFDSKHWLEGPQQVTVNQGSLMFGARSRGGDISVIGSTCSIGKNSLNPPDSTQAVFAVACSSPPVSSRSQDPEWPSEERKLRGF
ncbi:hypothetical protein LshimejAT787_1103430 [Lyophyllum shimeji]|uniref:Uncharacterized protein n=1 Tax=Lyophyllum shimeji TaxID=47721 RepID=A0A9P3PUM7_LYOSH|nr:hypothetical protein LshimejAT787_1103430 [Lyophyllum shimeji]